MSVGRESAEDTAEEARTSFEMEQDALSRRGRKSLRREWAGAAATGGLGERKRRRRGGGGRGEMMRGGRRRRGRPEIFLSGDESVREGRASSVSP